MSTIINQVQLLGNLGSDVEVKELSTGAKVGRVNIATNKYFRNKEGEKGQKTQWHSLVAWDKTAELMEQFLRKGSRVVIHGELVNDSYTNKEGKKVFSTKVRVNQFEKLDPKEEKLPF